MWNLKYVGTYVQKKSVRLEIFDLTLLIIWIDW